jgi:hypothetical protein
LGYLDYDKAEDIQSEAFFGLHVIPGGYWERTVTCSLPVLVGVAELPA